MTYAAQLGLDDALERLEGTVWHAAALRSIDVLNANFTTWSAEDLRSLAGDPPIPNALGALLKSLAQRGVIRPAGFVEAQRSEARGRAIRLWARG